MHFCALQSPANRGGNCNDAAREAQAAKDRNFNPRPTGVGTATKQNRSQQLPRRNFNPRPTGLGTAALDGDGFLGAAVELQANRGGNCNCPHRSSGSLGCPTSIPGQPGWELQLAQRHDDKPLRRGTSIPGQPGWELQPAVSRGPRPLPMPARQDVSVSDPSTSGHQDDYTTQRFWILAVSISARP